jgi:alkanesulfonate monooxygenase SsuD/methylene tetrahydromethanopterin reductase-like flavin-dependent oxidoreductase (luciferase family)
MSGCDLRIGVKLPTLVRDAGEYLADAAAFDAAGADSLWLSESVFRPAGVQRPYAPAHEPWTLLAAIAAVTHRARLGTAVSVVTVWPPALFASAATTLDHLARGRLLVGAGAGWEPAQFAAAGLDFHDRGRRLDEFLAAVRHLWTEPEQPFQGRFYELPALHLAQPFRPGGPPLLVGAFSEPGYRRAAALADGFVHGGGPPERVAGTIRHIDELRAAIGREGPFEHWVQVRSPAGRPDWRETLDAYAATGAAGLIVPASSSLLDLLRNPDDEGDRSDLLLAQG